jgi:serralysin
MDTTGLTIVGTSGTDTINAFSSAPGQLLPSELGDNIDGRGGEDDISGLGGKDTIHGGAQDDDLNGDAGNDILTGGTGRDRLTGGSEKDFFDFNAIGESVIGSARDRIFDFSRSQGDRIDLRDIDAKSGVSGNNTFKFIGTDAFNDVKVELRFKDLGSDGIVQGDVNGNGVADFEIRVNVGSMVKADFIL